MFSVCGILLRRIVPRAYDKIPLVAGIESAVLQSADVVGQGSGDSSLGQQVA